MRLAAERERQAEQRHEVRLHHARGAELLEPMTWEQRWSTVARALQRTFPFLTVDERLVQFQTTARGKALDVTAILPTSGTLSREQLERPIFQFRFGRELYREAVARLGVREVAPRPPATPGGALSRGLSTVLAHLAGERLRNAVADPGGTVARVGFDALSRALPSPLRAVQTIGRFVGRVAHQEE